MFKNEVIDRYCFMQNLKNAQVSIYSLAHLNIGHCVELTFSEGYFLCSTVVKPSYRENDKSSIEAG